MTDAIKWAVPIKRKVRVLADNDMSRGLRGQDPTIPFGTEVRLSDPLGWLDRLKGRSSKTRVVSWPHGVQPTKSRTVQVTDTTGMLEAYAEVDKALADLNGNTASWRLSEEKPHIEGMGQEVVQTLFYGNEGTEPEAFTGLSPRFNSLSAANAENIIDAGGTGTDNASIWLCVWDPSVDRQGNYGYTPFAIKFILNSGSGSARISVIQAGTMGG